MPPLPGVPTQNVTIVSGAVPLDQGPQAIQWLLDATPSAPNTVSMTVSFGWGRRCPCPCLCCRAVYCQSRALQRYDPKNLLRELDYYKKDEGRSAEDASLNTDVRARR